MRIRRVRFRNPIGYPKAVTTAEEPMQIRVLANDSVEVYIDGHWRRTPAANIVEVVYDEDPVVAPAPEPPAPPRRKK